MLKKFNLNTLFNLIKKRFFLLIIKKEVIIIFNNRYPRIRSLREDHDLTQKEISKILNMSQTGYSKYETGENDIPSKILIELAKYYKTSVDYLLGITEEIKPYP